VDDESTEDKLLLRQSPLNDLHLYLSEKHKIKDPPKNFIKPTSTMLPGSRVAWTAEYTCPISGRVIKCGRIRLDSIPSKSKSVLNGVDKVMELDLTKIEDDDDDENGDDTKGDADAGTENGERTLFYTRKHIAIQAAAARALDIYRYEETQIKEPRTCAEDPAVNSSMTRHKKSNEVNISTKKRATEVATDMKTEEASNQTASKEGEEPLFRGSPSWELDFFYRSHLNHTPKDPVNSFMECEMATHAGNSVWTARFTCPVSGRIFQTGTLRPEYSQGVKKHPGNSFEIRSPGKSSLKRIFYQRKSTATHAAAARALDLLRFERDGTLEPRLCDEDPLEYGMDSDSDGEEEGDDDESQDEKDTDLVPYDEPLPISSPKLKVELIKSSPSPEVKEEVLSPASDSVDGADDREDETLNVEIWDDEDDDDSSWDSDQFVVEQSPSLNNQSPALNVLSSLTKSSNSGSVLNLEVLGSSIVESEDSRYSRLWNEAYLWVESQGRRPKASASLHGIDLPPRQRCSNTLAIAKSLLASLGELNYSSFSPLHSSQGPAFAILNFLWDTKHAKPDTEVYNLYMRCLEATDPVTRAIRAESIVERMKSRGSLQGHLPPKPDAESFNTLLGIWAQVGGENGRYSKMEPSFEPTKDSFLAVLSSSSYGGDDVVFDLEFAKQCVNKMKQEEEQGSKYEVDIRVMNAPLRWSGGLLWKKTRPHTRRIKWDNLLAAYSNGFRQYSESDPLVQNAQNIEQWVNGMGEYEVAPDLESFEAMIQAWARTGTREGLEKAESLIEEIADSPNLSFRIQTFHPILAAWLYVQHSDSPSKILKWIDYIKSRDDEALKRSFSGGLPDRRFVCLELASRILQLGQDANSKSVNDFSMEDVHALPRQCSELLERMVEDIKDSSDQDHSKHLHMVIEPFLLTMTAWSRSIPPKCSNPEVYRATIESMIEVVDSFESVVQEAAARETRQTEMAAEGLSEDLRLLVSHSYAIHSCFVARMRDVALKWQDQQAENQLNALLPFICDLERVVRRMEETHQIGKTVSAGEDWPHLVYADRYKYDFHLMMDLPSRPDKGADCWSLASLLESIQVKESYVPDLISLCYLLKKIGPASSRRSNFDEKVNKLLDQVLKGGQHRKSILASMKGRGNRNHQHAHAQKDRRRSGGAKKVSGGKSHSGRGRSGRMLIKRA